MDNNNFEDIKFPTISKKYIILLIFGISLFIITSFLLGTYYPRESNISQMANRILINERLKMDNSIKELNIKHKNELDILDNSIKELQGKITLSQTSFMNAQREITRLQKEMGTNERPKNIKDARKRLLDMGYSTY